MVLAQDQAQANEAAEIVAEQENQAELIRYEKDMIAWEKEKKKIETANKKIVAAEEKRRAAEKAANEKAEIKRLADNKAGLLQYDKDLAQYEKNLALQQKEKEAITVVKAEQTRVAKAKIESQRIAQAKAAEEKRILDIKKAEEKRILDIAQAEEKARQEVITKNKEYWATPKNERGWLNEKAIHHARIQGVPTKDGDIKYYEGGIFTDSYFERASETLGISIAQARQVSQTGRTSQSGKARDNTLRQIQDSIDGGNRQEQYTQHRALAAKTTASAYGAMAVKEAQQEKTQLQKLHDVSGGLIGKETPTDIYGSESLMGTNVKAPQGTIEQQIQNAKQTQRTIDLREGNVGLATALLEPITENKVSKNNTVNLEKFLVERGYDLNNLDAVPNEVFKPVKYVEARKQATVSEKTNTPMGDLTKLIPPQPTMYEQKKVGETTVGVTKNEYFKKVPNAELKKRIEARERIESIGVIPEAPKIVTTDSVDVKGGSYIGYGVDGTPIQGAVQVKQQWSVETGKTQPVTVTKLDGSTYTARQKSAPLLFDTQQAAQAYIDYENKTNPMNIGQQFNTVGNNQGQFLSDYYKLLDDTGKKWQSDKGIGGSIYRHSQLPGIGIGLQKMAVGLVIQVDNLATQNIAPYVSGSLKPTPLVQSSESSDQVIFPYNFEQMRWKTGEEVFDASSKYIETYGMSDFVGGVAGGYYIGAKGLQSMSPVARKMIPMAVEIPSKAALGGTVKVTKNVPKTVLQVPPVITATKQMVQAINPIKIERYDQVGVTLLESGNDGQVLYHGTNTKAAENIIKDGFDLSKSKTSGLEDDATKTIFTNTDQRGAYGDLGTTLKITMKDGAKEFDVNKQVLDDDDLLRSAAKDEKADTITNMMQGQQQFGREVELASTKNIKSIEVIDGSLKGKKWTNPELGLKLYTVSIGYGSRLQPMVSRVGSTTQLGSPNIARSNVSKVVIDPSLQPDPKRGVKMAAGNTQYEQKLAPQLIPLVEGISKAEIRKAEIIQEIQKITTSKAKDTMFTKTLPKDSFSTLTKKEQKQILEIMKKAQRARQDPVGPYEGSVSQPYFVSPYYTRRMGDVDIHSETFEQGKRMLVRFQGVQSQTTGVYHGGIVPSFGRKFIYPIDDTKKTIQGISQTSERINYVDTAAEAERLNREFMQKSTNIKFVDTVAYRLEQTKKYNLSPNYFGNVSRGHLFGQFQKSHDILNRSRRIVSIPETVIIEKNALSNFNALNPSTRTKYLDEYGRFDNKAWQQTVKQHELIHKANPNLTETQVRVLADEYGVDEFGMTKAMLGSMDRPLALPKSQKVDTRTGKFLEILNQEQVDETGAVQVISGDTIFGKAIPTQTYKVSEGVTYGRQRQIVKKGESLYSLQKDESGNVTVSAFSPRAPKDTADFYALAESARMIEDYSPSEKAKLGKLLDEFKESQKTDDFDVDDYLKNNAINQSPNTEPIIVNVGTSLIQKTEKNVGVAAAYVATPSIQSSKFISVLKSESTPQTKTSPRIESNMTSITSKTNVKSITSRPSLTTTKVSTSSTSVLSTSRPITSVLSTSRPSISRPSTSRPSSSRPSTSRPSTSRPSTSRPSTSRPNLLRSRPIRSRPSSSRSSSANTSLPNTARSSRKIIPLIVLKDEFSDDDNSLKKKKGKDFLGNSKLDNIVGLFKRTEVIYGDKLTAKQLKRDKRHKTVKTKRKKKKKKSYGQRIGVIEKGFKI